MIFIVILSYTFLETNASVVPKPPSNEEHRQAQAQPPAMNGDDVTLPPGIPYPPGHPKAEL